MFSQPTGWPRGGLLQSRLAGTGTVRTGRGRDRPSGQGQREREKGRPVETSDGALAQPRAPRGGDERERGREKGMDRESCRQEEAGG